MTKKCDERALRYVKLCVFRQQGAEEDWIAKELGPGTPEALYKQLSHDGFPVCTVCGETPAQPDHCKRKRKARKSTEEAQLPSPESAASYFRVALAWLEEDIASLPLFEERLQGERFVGMFDEPEEELLLYRRMFYKFDWEQMCSNYGYDSAPNTLLVEGTGTTQPCGANRTPARPLVRLIAAYALVNESLKPLLDTLHPNPTSIVENKLSEKVDQLELVAGQVATLVRGGTLRRGPSTEGVSREEQGIAWSISQRREEGASDEKILQEIAYMGHYAYGRCLTEDDISRLGDLRLGPPPY
jgi:hypothetical protein